MPRDRQQVAGNTLPRWFAQGPVYLDKAALAARKGGNAMLVWLAVRACEAWANGKPITVEKIVEATGLSDRTARWAVAALVEAGLLRRDGLGISTVDFEEG